MGASADGGQTRGALQGSATECGSLVFPAGDDAIGHPSSPPSRETRLLVVVLVLLGPHTVRASVVDITIGQRVQETERAKKKDTAQNDRKPLPTRLNSIRGLLAVTLLVFLATAAGTGSIAPNLFSLHGVRQFIRSSIFVCNQKSRRLHGSRPVDCPKFPPGPACAFPTFECVLSTGPYGLDINGGTRKPSARSSTDR